MPPTSNVPFQYEAVKHKAFYHMLCLTMFLLGDCDHHQDIQLKALKTSPKYEEQKYHGFILDM